MPILVFGEVLFDQFPDGSQLLGGAPFNVAWHLQAFNQQPLMISRIGNDVASQKILSAMNKWGMNTELVQIDAAHPTGTVKIELISGEPAYKILTEQAYDYIEELNIGNFDTAKVLYHGTLATRSPKSFKTLLSLLKTHNELVFVDVNLREGCWDHSTTLAILKYANWVKLNLEELKQLHGLSTDIQLCMAEFLNLYDLDGVILTCGENGAHALNKNDEFCSISPKSQLTDITNTVGAGDAFSSIMLIGITQNWPLPVTMARAQLFAEVILKQSGALINDKNIYQTFTQSWLI